MTEKIIPVKCTSSHTIDVSELRPIQGNLKKRTHEQLYNLKTLILKYGFSFPIYIWQEQYAYTLDGHGRDFVCKQLIEEGYLFQQKDGTINSSIPCVYIDAANRAEAKEKLLALNSSFGEITNEGLYAFLTESGSEINFEIVKENLEIPSLDLSTFESDFLLGPTEDKPVEKEYKFIFSQEQIKETIKENFPTYLSLEQLIDGVIDVPLAMHQFNKLCTGNKNVGSNISLLFNPHRLETKINKRTKSAAEQFLEKDGGLISSISQWMSKQQDVVHHRQYIDVAKANTGTQIAHEFKPYLARDIYLDYCKEDTKVLDPCAGWGGRMIGFTSTLLGGEYFATDPSTKTYNGLFMLRMFLLSAEFLNPPQISLHDQPFEYLVLPENYFDFAFTSPPYFDTEMYADEETQAYNRYKTLDEFNEKFLTILIQNTIRALKPGACFLLNIGGSQFRFDKAVEDICHKLCLEMKEVFKYKIGKGEHFIEKFEGDPLDNLIKANDLFFEIRKPNG